MKEGMVKFNRWIFNGFSSLKNGIAGTFSTSESIFRFFDIFFFLKTTPSWYEIINQKFARKQFPWKFYLQLKKLRRFLFPNWRSMKILWWLLYTDFLIGSEPECTLFMCWDFFKLFSRDGREFSGEFLNGTGFSIEPKTFHHFFSSLLNNEKLRSLKGRDRH